MITVTMATYNQDKQKGQVDKNMRDYSLCFDIRFIKI